MNEETVLIKKAYFFVPYNISAAQIGIQAGHSLGRYALKYGRNDPNHIVWDFLENHETWIVLDGGTTNEDRDFEGIAAGTMNQIGDSLLANAIEFSYFHEPDLNHALSALCFIADERVFDRENYPEFIDFLLEKLYNDTASSESIVRLRMIPYERLLESYEKEYKEWVRLIGGVKNVFLRELIRDKQLA